MGFNKWIWLVPIIFTLSCKPHAELINPKDLNARPAIADDDVAPPPQEEEATDEEETEPVIIIVPPAEPPLKEPTLCSMADSYGWVSFEQDVQHDGDSVPLDSIYDAAGKLWVVGYQNDEQAKPQWVVQSSEDAGISWQLSDLYVHESGYASSAQSISIGADGAIYVAGYGEDLSATKHWIVRKYLNGAWETLDEYQLIDGQNAQASAVEIDSLGRLVVVGQADFDHGVSAWITRTLSDSGWQTSDLFLLDGSHSSFAKDIQKDGYGNLYAVGWGLDSTVTSRWVVRKYSVENDQWSTVDDYKYNNADTHATVSGVDNEGNIYVGGYGHDDAGKTRWIVRRTVTAGTFWVNSDEIQIDSESAKPLAIRSDANGVPHVAGYRVDDLGNVRWVVRKLEDSGFDWVFVDDQSFGGGSIARTMALSPEGEFFVLGSGFSSSWSWIVRMFCDPSAEQ